MPMASTRLSRPCAARWWLLSLDPGSRPEPAAAHRLGDARRAERRRRRGRGAAARLRAGADELEHLGGELVRGGEEARREVLFERREAVHAQAGAAADE